MPATRTRRLAPLLIATLLAGAGASLSSTAFAAPTTTTANVTTDSDNPLLDAFSKSGKVDKIGNNTANGGDTQPPTSGDGGDGLWGSGHGSNGGDEDGDPNSDPLNITDPQHPYPSPWYPDAVNGSESRTDDAHPGPVIDNTSPSTSSNLAKIFFGR
ncbi:hypothetical protein [Streptomyces sp. NBC_01233]|uniref:hypothetical protein n=1 Tax=Streptomyces sp. NBC_01233 TaxID=2903787 RepID=UPI002E161264|nr:hypothetical protein OG332_00990 [Streptomyces sp. NBC_01233]